MCILICIAIILILLIIHAVWPKYVYNPGYEDIQIVDILKDQPDMDLQTGDIVLFKSCVKCRYNDSFMDNWFSYFYKNTFNSFRWYLLDEQYTHASIIICLDDKPYICHMDGGDPMYDELQKKWVKKVSCVVSGYGHINRRGGVMHIYKYKGPPIKKNMMPWIEKNRNTHYPKSFVNLVKVNALKWGTHPSGIKACTDFVESTLHYAGVLNSEHVSKQSTISDIVKLVKTNENYEHIPVMVKNKCYENRHF